jgi:hypothetical protein
MLKASCHILSLLRQHPMHQPSQSQQQQDVLLVLLDDERLL